MKRILIIIFTGVLLLVTIFLIFNKNFTSKNTDLTANNNQTDPDQNNQTSKSDYSIESVVNYVPDSHKEAAFNKAKSFVLLGRGANGRVADSKGNIIYKPESGDGVYAAEPNPNGNLVYIYLGKISFVINPQSNERVDIPSKPSDPDMLGFGSWIWVDDDFLITTSGIKKLDNTGKPFNCCEGHNIEESKLYSFRVSSRQLNEVSLPKSITAKVFTINRVSSDGYFEITTDEDELFEGHKAGWFKVIAP